MLGCDNIITLIHHNRDDDDTYICTVLKNASWFKKITIATTGEGAKPTNTYEARVMGDMDINVSPGDFVALGEVESVETRSDFEHLDHFRITAIGDNRRGGMPHWRFSGQ